MTPSEKLQAIHTKNRAYAVLMQLENQAQRLRNSGRVVPAELAGRVVPAELAGRIEQARIEYQFACDKCA